MTKQPIGAGAIEFAKQFIDGMTMEEARPVINQLCAGKLHDKTDKRVKTCTHCGYLYRDKTKPNNSRTCSPACKKAKDKLSKKEVRTRVRESKPKKKSYIEKYYRNELEYAYWRHGDKRMNVWFQQVESSHSPEKIEQIDAAIQRYEMIGGRKKKVTAVPYGGSTYNDCNADEQAQKVAVKFPKGNARKPGAVESYRLSREEIDSLMRSRYTVEHLERELRRSKAGRSPF